MQRHLLRGEAHVRHREFIFLRLRILRYIELENWGTFANVARHIDDVRVDINFIYRAVEQINNVEPRRMGRPPTTLIPVFGPPQERGSLGMVIAVLVSPRPLSLPPQLHAPDPLRTSRGYISRTQYTLDISVYLVTERDLVTEVIDAADRGVIVRIYIDLRQAQEWPGAYRQFHGHERIQMNHRTAQTQEIHEKFFICDGEYVIIESHNWTGAAFTRNHVAGVLTTHLRRDGS